MSRSLPLTTLFIAFFSVDFPYQFGFRQLPFIDSVTAATIEAVFFTIILLASTRLDLARVTLCFLALPYFIFFPGWLNTPTAIVLLAIFIYCLVKTLRSTHTTLSRQITLRDFLAFVLIIIWVNISGAGGFGYQTPDYYMHNARLKDLVEQSWPVRYGNDQNFVYYFGYFLPASIIGKLFNLHVAVRSMYIITLLGVMLALRWLSHFGKWPVSIPLALIFMLFGPIDSLNVLILNHQSNIAFHDGIKQILSNSDFLDFRTRYNSGFFIGNYLSNTFQLYWSPQQVIAAWLGISLLTHLYMEKQMAQFLFVYSLFCLWSPLAMIAVLPFVFVALVVQIRRNLQVLLTPENTICAGAVILIFMSFYIGGSAGKNPSLWLLDQISRPTQFIYVILLYLAGWGLYATLIRTYLQKTSADWRLWFYCLLFSLLLLPIKSFGEWADLMCRGSAPLMFLLLVFLLRALRHYWFNHHKATAVLIMLLWITGTMSAMLQLRSAVQHYGEIQPMHSVIMYNNAYPNLGPDNTFFNRYFRHKLH